MPESAVRSGVLGLPMALLIIGGMPERLVRLGSSGSKRLSIDTHGFLADTPQEAAGNRKKERPREGVWTTPPLEPFLSFRSRSQKVATVESGYTPSFASSRKVARRWRRGVL